MTFAERFRSFLVKLLSWLWNGIVCQMQWTDKLFSVKYLKNNWNRLPWNFEIRCVFAYPTSTSVWWIDMKSCIDIHFFPREWSLLALTDWLKWSWLILVKSENSQKLFNGSPGTFFPVTQVDVNLDCNEVKFCHQHKFKTCKTTSTSVVLCH